MSDDSEISLQIDLSKEEVDVLVKMAESRGLSVEDFVSKVLSMYPSSLA